MKNICGIIIGISIAISVISLMNPAMALESGGVETHTKHVDVWYGSVTGPGCPANLDALEATTHITDNLALQINDTYPDDRVKNLIYNWVNISAGDYEWVNTSSENLNAEQNLKDKLSLLASQCGQGTLTFDAPSNQDTISYYLTSWITLDDIIGGLVEIWHDAYGEVSYHELNAHFVYNFTGFFQPVDNLPVVNSVNAGRAIPLKFSLGGYQGMGI